MRAAAKPKSARAAGNGGAGAGARVGAGATTEVEYTVIPAVDAGRTGTRGAPLPDAAGRAPAGRAIKAAARCGSEKKLRRAAAAAAAWTVGAASESASSSLLLLLLLIGGARVARAPAVEDVVTGVVVAPKVVGNATANWAAVAAGTASPEAIAANKSVALHAPKHPMQRKKRSKKGKKLVEGA